MTEEFLYYIWQHHVPLGKKLKSTDGKLIIILTKGERNTDAGPDFFNARIQIGNNTWAGNVELHLKASDWARHSHHQDPAYNNTILHVVQCADKPVFTSNGRKITCLKPENLLEDYRKYRHHFQQKTFIPCEENIIHTTIPNLNFWLQKLIIERWEEFYDSFLQRLTANENDWEETHYQLLMQNFGLKINREVFEQLSRSLPLKTLLKHKNSLMQIESLLFGQAGFLEDKSMTDDDYYADLVREYNFLKKKYKLKNLHKSQWKFLRLRPANFPTIRLAQLATLIYHTSNLFSQVIAADSHSRLKDLLRCNASTYWDNHYNFKKKTTFSKSKKIGTTMQHLLLINCFLPTMFAYGHHYSRLKLKERSLEFLEKLPPEKNAIITSWKNVGISSNSAFYSQALLQLKKKYCNFKQCLRCVIGHQLLNKIYG